MVVYFLLVIVPAYFSGAFRPIFSPIRKFLIIHHICINSLVPRTQKSILEIQVASKILVRLCTNDFKHLLNKLGAYICSEAQK